MNLHNSTMTPIHGSYYRSSSNGAVEQKGSVFSNINKQASSERPSFSSLFASQSNILNDYNNNYNPKISSSFESGRGSFESLLSETSASDDDGIWLQISNLDQWLDENNLRNYLTNQLKPITPILSLKIETPSIAKVKVPSVQVTFFSLFSDEVLTFVS